MSHLEKVFITIPRYGADLGGVTSHVDTLIRSLQTRNHQVAYWASQKPNLVGKALAFVGAGFSAPLARQNNIRQRQEQLKRWLQTVDVPQVIPHLIHVHDPFAAQVAVRLEKSPVVLTTHGPASREILMDFGDQKTSDFIRQIEAEAYHKADVLIAVDEGQAQILVKDFSIPRERITVIPNAVDSTEVVRQAMAQANHPLVVEATRERSAGKQIVLIPRRLVEKNGVHQAVRCLPLLPKNYHFWIAGDGPMAEGIQTYLKLERLENRVRLLGAQKHSTVLGLMRQADVVLVPSIPAHGVVEATSIAALEAMALSKPLVASNIGGLAEMIESGNNGLLYKPDNLEELSTALISLEDKEKGRSLGRNAQQYVAKTWSVEKWITSIEQEYRKALT